MAELMVALGDRGVPLARPVAAVSGELAPTVVTPSGTVRAMCVRAAAGEETGAEELTEERARAWGRLLAEVHDRAAGLGGDLPDGYAGLAGARTLFADDPDLVAAVERLRTRLGELPRDAGRYGVVHGDFELDNLVWRGDAPTAFDFDETSRSWYAADVASAVRDLTVAGVPGSPGRAALLDAFTAGYRDRRALPDADLALLPLFTAANAALSLVGLCPALRPSGDDRENKLGGLREDLLRYREEQRRTVLTVAAGG
ncbi:phosphotransferase enzyme family protein [Streptomyces sp. JNUCC 64]